MPGSDPDSANPTCFGSVALAVLLRLWLSVAVFFRAMLALRRRSLTLIEREELDKARKVGSSEEIAMWIDRIDRRRDRLWDRIGELPTLMPGVLVMLALAVSSPCLVILGTLYLIGF